MGILQKGFTYGSIASNVEGLIFTTQIYYERFETNYDDHGGESHRR